VNNRARYPDPVINDRPHAPHTTHAIVIGGSIAGLLAARVLADHFDRVTMIERDHLPDRPQPRKGVPQASHVHVLLAKGLHIIESLYPGISSELLADGALPVDWGKDLRGYTFIGWMPHYDDGPRTLNCSRDLLEYHLRRRTLALPSVRTVQGCDVIGLLRGEANRIAGVELRARARWAYRRRRAGGRFGRGC
jgi:2-polyprenyl-6-methoxyphenol hydroxylase-like FAD-dependent oxidoreductase